MQRDGEGHVETGGEREDEGAGVAAEDAELVLDEGDVHVETIERAGRRHIGALIVASDHQPVGDLVVIHHRNHGDGDTVVEQRTFDVGREGCDPAASGWVRSDESDMHGVAATHFHRIPIPDRPFGW